jgi:hypothetical protein
MRSTADTVAALIPPRPRRRTCLHLIVPLPTRRLLTQPIGGRHTEERLHTRPHTMDLRLNIDLPLSIEVSRLAIPGAPRPIPACRTATSDRPRRLAPVRYMDLEFPIRLHGRLTARPQRICMVRI